MAYSACSCSPLSVDAYLAYLLQLVSCAPVTLLARTKHLHVSCEGTAWVARLSARVSFMTCYGLYREWVCSNPRLGF